MLNYQRVLEMSDVTSMDSTSTHHRPLRSLSKTTSTAIANNLSPPNGSFSTYLDKIYQELSRYIKNYQAKIRPLLGMIPLTSATQKQRQIHQNNQRIWRHGYHGAEKLKTCVMTMTPMTTQASTKPPPTSHGGVHYESGWNPRSRCEFLQFLRCKPGISTPSGWWFQPREKWKSQYMGK